MKKIILSLLVLITLHSTAQVGIGTRIPDPSAMFEVKSNSKGVLISRMTESERSSIKTPVAGLLVYQTDRSAGFYYHTGIEWKYLPPEAISQPLNSSTTTNGVLASTATATTYIFNSPLVENLGAVSLPKATSVASGYLSSADWNTFNNKVSIANAQAALNTKLTANSAIIGGTKTKITYDSKGLVTAGANATTNDITEGTNLYFTEQRVRNTPLTGYTVGTNTAVANTDNLMGSIAKLQGQINAKQTSGQVWLLGGNAGTNPSTQFVGTNDNKDLVFKVNNIESGRINILSNNTSFGYGVLKPNVSGFKNSAFGSGSLYSNSTGSNNTAIGYSSLYSNTTGVVNTAIGSASLQKNTTGNQNTALGFGAGGSLTNGDNNIFIGYNAGNNNSFKSTSNKLVIQNDNSLTPLIYGEFDNKKITINGDMKVTGNYISDSLDNTRIGTNSLAHKPIENYYSNVGGNYNTSIGANALFSNTSGYANSANGRSALYSNTSGRWNTANGASSLYSNTEGNANTANGLFSLMFNIVGNYNTANGQRSLNKNTTGSYNTANGSLALYKNTTGYHNTANGDSSLLFNITGNYNTGIGFNSNVGSENLTNATAIGSSSRVDCDNCLVLGSVNGENNATSSVRVGIGTTNPDPSAVLEVKSTTQGLLLPRMTADQRDNIADPAQGLVVYCTNCGKKGQINVFSGTEWTNMNGDTTLSPILIDTSTALGPLLGVQKGLNMWWKFAGPDYIVAANYHSTMGDECFIPWGNYGYRWGSQVNKITLPDGTVINNPVGLEQTAQLQSTNNVAAGDLNSFKYEWKAMYSTIAESNSLIQYAKNPIAAFPGDSITQQKVLNAFGYWWRGWAYSRIGSMYISGFVNNISGDPNYVPSDYLSNIDIIKEANANLDSAINILSSITLNATYSQMLTGGSTKSIIPSFCNTKGLITPENWKRLCYSMKARNLLVNTKIKNANISFWNEVSTLASQGLKEGDLTFTVGFTPDFTNDISGGFWSSTLMLSDSFGWLFGTERLLQDYQAGDARKTRNWQTYPGGINLMNPRGRGIQFGSTFYAIEAKDGGEYTTADGSYNIQQYLAPSYEENQLMLAEAKINIGNIEEGLIHLDKARAVQSTGLTSAAGHGLSANEAKEKVRSERRVGLFLRGLSFYDARRWNITAPVAESGGRANAMVLVPIGFGNPALTTPTVLPCFMEYNYMDYWDIPVYQ